MGIAAEISDSDDGELKEQGQIIEMAVKANKEIDEILSDMFKMFGIDPNSEEFQNVEHGFINYKVSTEKKTGGEFHELMLLFDKLSVLHHNLFFHNEYINVMVKSLMKDAKLLPEDPDHCDYKEERVSMVIREEEEIEQKVQTLIDAIEKDSNEQNKILNQIVECEQWQDIETRMSAGTDKLQKLELERQDLIKQLKKSKKLDKKRKKEESKKKTNEKKNMATQVHNLFDIIADNLEQNNKEQQAELKKLKNDAKAKEKAEKEAKKRVKKQKKHQKLSPKSKKKK